MLAVHNDLVDDADHLGAVRNTVRLLVCRHLCKILAQLHDLAADGHFLRAGRHVQLVAHIGRGRLFNAAFFLGFFQLFRQLVDFGILVAQHLVFGGQLLAVFTQGKAQFAHRHPVHIVKRHTGHFAAVCQPCQRDILLHQQFQQLRLAQIHQFRRGFLHLRRGKALGGRHQAVGFIPADTKLFFHDFFKPAVFGMLFQHNQSTPQFKHPFHRLPHRMAAALYPCRLVVGFAVAPLLHHHNAVHGGMVAGCVCI